MTLHSIKAAGFIVTNGDLVFGVGKSDAEAFASAVKGLQIAGIRVTDTPSEVEIDNGLLRWMHPNDLNTYPATSALMEQIEAGGADNWHERDGVSCIRGEAFDEAE